MADLAGCAADKLSLCWEPLILRGSKAAMTNLNDPTRFDLLGVPNDVNGNAKASAAVKLSERSIVFIHVNVDVTNSLG